jgi:acyl-CoA thioester hydrolase
MIGRAMDDVTEQLLQPAPFQSSVMAVEPAWIDYNGHLNMAYYNVLFDRAIDELWLRIGIGPGYRTARNNSTFSAECHVRYVREIGLDDPVRVSVLVVASDAKRIHTFQELRHAGDGWLSATSENMSLHMDMTARKVAPFPSDIAERLAALTQAHAGVARPEGIGRSIGMPSQTGRRR